MTASCASAPAITLTPGAPTRPAARHVPAGPAQHRVATGGEAGEVGHRAARDEADGALPRQAEQVEQPGLGDLLHGGVGRGSGAQAGVLVPRADEPVGGQRRGVGAADDEAEEPPRRHRGEPGLAGPRQEVDDVLRRGRSLREVGARGWRPPAPASADGGTRRSSSEASQSSARAWARSSAGCSPGVPVMAAPHVGSPVWHRPTYPVLRAGRGAGAGAGAGGVAPPRRGARRADRRPRGSAPVAPGRWGEAPGPRLPVHLLLPAPGPAAALAPRVRRAARRRARVRRAAGLRLRRRHVRVRRVAGAAAARARQPAARATESRPAHTGCFGLHEWAMVYGQSADEVRHTTGRCGSGRRAPTPSSSRTASSARTSTRSASSRGRRVRSTRCSPGATTGRRTSSRGACTPGWTSTSTPSGSRR